MRITEPNHEVLREGWRDDAACIGQPTEWWFPTVLQGRRHEPGKAEEICRTCPVRAECLRLAVTSKAPDGVWGGLLRTYRSR